MRAAEATTEGCRVVRFVTAVPSPIRSVPSATAVSTLNTSRQSNWESGIQTSSKPSSSARRTTVTSRSARSHGGTLMPIRSRPAPVVTVPPAGRRG